MRSHQQQNSGALEPTQSPQGISSPTRPFHHPPREKQVNTTGLPNTVLQKMQKSFNADFSGIKVFSGSTRAANLKADAYTQGHHIHFAPGRFNPHSSEGEKLLTHELSHVMQQRQGRVKPTTSINGLPVNDDPALEKEADTMGSR